MERLRRGVRLSEKEILVIKNGRSLPLVREPKPIFLEVELTLKRRVETLTFMLNLWKGITFLRER